MGKNCQPRIPHPTKYPLKYILTQKFLRRLISNILALQGIEKQNFWLKEGKKHGNAGSDEENQKG